MLRILRHAPALDAPDAGPHATVAQPIAPEQQPSQLLGLPRLRSSVRDRATPWAQTILKSPFVPVVVGLGSGLGVRQRIASMRPEVVKALETTVSTHPGMIAAGTGVLFAGAVFFARPALVMRLDQIASEAAARNFAVDHETGPHAVAVCDALTQIIASFPELEREQRVEELASRWDDLRDPFFQVFNGTHEEKTLAAELLGTEPALRSFGALDIQPEVRERSWAILELFVNTPTGLSKKLQILNEEQGRQLGLLWNETMAALPSRAVHRWRVLAGLAAAENSAAWTLDSSSVATTILGRMGVESQTCAEALQAATLLTSPEGVALAERHDNLSAAARRLARSFVVAKPLHHGPSAGAAQPAFHGTKTRQELSTAGFLDSDGLTPTARLVVEANIR